MKKRNLEHSDDWATPSQIKAKCCEFGKIDASKAFDPCPIRAKFDGLSIDWSGNSFVNPPYSRKLKEAFVNKAISEIRRGSSLRGGPDTVVMLLPVSTSTKLFHNTIVPNALRIGFFNKRIRFIGVNTKGVLVDDKSPMHDSMCVVFNWISVLSSSFRPEVESIEI